MFYDFLVAFIIGWFILLTFWLTIIFFIYLRKPPNSKLSKKIIFHSFCFFALILILIIIYGLAIRFV